MFAKLAVISMLVAVSAADSIDVKGCTETENTTMSVEWGTCTKVTDMNEWKQLTLVSGSVANETATANWTTYGVAGCTGNSENMVLMCECGDSTYQLVCEAAAGLIPSAILIIAAIMAHVC